jgi:DNA-binding MarR family transcriptional regulator
VTDPRQRRELGILLFVANRALEQRAFDAVVAAGITDITLAQARIAARIASDGSRVSDLAEQARVTKQTVTFMVDQLERAGYVRRVADPIDARARLVIFADRGLAAKEVARRTEVAVQDEWTRHLGRRATTRLHQILTQLREITDPYR